MNELFLKDLRKELRGFPKEEKEEILDYYSDYLAESRGENLPDPKEIVHNLLQEEIQESDFLPKTRKIILKTLMQSPQESLCQKSLKWHFLFLGCVIFLFHTFCGFMFAYGDDSWMIDPETGMAKSGFFFVLGVLAVVILAFQYFMVKTKKLPVIHGKTMRNLIAIFTFM